MVVQKADPITVHVPVVPQFPPDAPAELRRYRFIAREPQPHDRAGDTLVAYFNDPAQQRPFQRASAWLHGAAVEHLRGTAERDAAARVVQVHDYSDGRSGVDGNSSMLAGACGDAAARWLRPGAAERLPMLIATGELRPAERAKVAGDALTVLAVEGVARKLAAVRAALAEPEGEFEGRPVVVALPEANLHAGDPAEVAAIKKMVAALREFGRAGGHAVTVVEVRTLADVLAAWCGRDPWCSAEAAAQFAGYAIDATAAGETPTTSAPPSSGGAATRIEVNVSGGVHGPVGVENMHVGTMTFGMLPKG